MVQKLQSKGKPVPPCQQTSRRGEREEHSTGGERLGTNPFFFHSGSKKSFPCLHWVSFQLCKYRYHNTGGGEGLVEKRRLSVDLAVGEPQFTFCPPQQLFSAVYFLRGRVNLPLRKSEKATYSLPQVSVSRYERVTQIQPMSCKTDVKIPGHDFPHDEE